MLRIVHGYCHLGNVVASGTANNSTEVKTNSITIRVCTYGIQVLHGSLSTLKCTETDRQTDKQTNGRTEHLPKRYADERGARSRTTKKKKKNKCNQFPETNGKGEKVYIFALNVVSS